MYRFIQKSYRIQAHILLRTQGMREKIIAAELDDSWSFWSICVQCVRIPESGRVVCVRNIYVFLVKMKVIAIPNHTVWDHRKEDKWTNQRD